MILFKFKMEFKMFEKTRLKYYISNEVLEVYFMYRLICISIYLCVDIFVYSSIYIFILICPIYLSIYHWVPVV